MDDWDDGEYTLPGDGGAPLPSAITAERQPREVLEPHLSHTYDEAYQQDPAKVLRGYVASATIFSTTPAVGKEAWALCHVIADRIEALEAREAAMAAERVKLEAELARAKARLIDCDLILQTNVRTRARNDADEQRAVIANREYFQALKEQPHAD